MCFEISFLSFQAKKSIQNDLVSPARRLEKILKYIFIKVQRDEKENSFGKDE